MRKGDNNKLIYAIDNGKIHPLKSLQDVITGMVKGNSEFNMLDEQKVVYEEILKQSHLAQKDHKKRTVIVTGGPGTGIYTETANYDLVIEVGT